MLNSPSICLPSQCLLLHFCFVNTPCGLNLPITMGGPAQALRIVQNLIEADLADITLHVVDDDDLNHDLLSGLIPAVTSESDSTPKTLGIAPAFSKDGRLVAMAIAFDQANILLVNFTPEHSQRQEIEVRRTSDATRMNDEDAEDNTSDSASVAGINEYEQLSGLALLQQEVLCRSETDGASLLLAFDMVQLVLALYRDHGLHTSNVIHLPHPFPPRKKHPVDIIKAVTTGNEINMDNMIPIFDDLIYDSSKDRQLALQDWVALYISSLPDMNFRIEAIPRARTRTLSDLVSCLNI